MKISQSKFSSKAISFLVAFILILGSLPASAVAATLPYNAAVVTNTIPSTMVAGTTYRVSVTFRNTGSATWTNAGGYRLKAVGGSDPFTTTTSYALASTDAIKYYKTKAFTISMKAPATAGTYTTDWRMYRGTTAFGATFKKSVKVIPLVLTSIAITKPASKTSYYIGEKLDLTGLVVTGTYNNGTKKTLPITTANVTGFNSTKPVTGQLLKITYGGKTAYYRVNILNVVLKSIAITKPATKLNYYIGEPLNLTGLVVTGTYSNGVKRALPITTANVTGFNSSKPVTGQVLTITYGGKTTTYKVNILPILVTGILVTGGDTVVNGNTLQLGATVTPANATNKTIAWAVGTLDGGAATIDSTGLLTASAAGTVTVTATNVASGVQGTKVVTILPVDPALLAVATAAVENLEAAATLDLTLEANLLTAEAAVVTANTETAKLPPVAERTALEDRIAAAAAIVTAARATFDAILAAAETAVAAYESAPVSTLAEIAAAEALKAPAETAVSAVTDATAKAGFTARISNRAAAIAVAKAVIQSEQANQAAAETAIAALEAAPLTNIAQCNTAWGLKTTADTKTSLVLDTAAKNGFLQRIVAKTQAIAIAELNLQTYFGSMEAALEKYNPVLGLDFTQYYSLANRAPVQTALLTPVFVTVADIKAAFDAAVAAEAAAEASPIAAFKNATTAAEMATAITTHATALSLGLTEYNALTAGNKAFVQNAMLFKNYQTGEDVKLAFLIAVINYTNNAGVSTLLSNNAVILGLSSGYSTLSTKSSVEAAVIAFKPIADKQEIIVAALSGTVNEWHVDQLVTLNKGLLGLDLTDYSKFEFRNKMKVQTAMIAATITSAADVQAAFNTSVAAQKAVETAGLQAFLDATDTAAIGTAITTYFAAADLGDYTGLMNKTPVQYELLIRTSFSSLVEVKTVLDAAAATEKALEATAMAAINNAATPDAMHAAILANAVTLGLVLTDYNTFPAADQAVVQNTMVAATFYATSVLKSTFDSAVATQKAVITINNTDAAGMGAVLTANATALGLNLSDYNLLTASSKDIVNAALVGRSFPDKAAVLTAFETAVSVPIINEITTTTAMATAISRYATVLGLNLTDYGALYAPYNVTVQTALLDPTFANAAEVKTVFDAAVAAAKEAKAVAAVNTAATAAAMHTALTTNAATLGLTLTDYNALANKVPVQNALLTPVFNTAAEVKAAFDTAVAVQKVNEAAVTAMGQVLTTSAAVLGLDLTDYTPLIYKEPVHAAMEAPTFATAAEVKAAFDTAVAAEKATEAPLLTIPAVRLNKPAVTLVVNATETLIATVLPYDAVNRDVTWATDNDTVASVDANGAVTAISAGTATITVTAVDGGYTDTCFVTVVVPVTGVVLNKTSTVVLVGGSETLTASVQPANATNKAVTWTSANPALITVDDNGKLTGVSAGVATNITVKTVDGSFSAICSVRAITEATAISYVNNAILNSMPFTITTYGPALGLDLTDYNALPVYEQGQVQVALVAPTFTTAAQIRTAFNTAVGIQFINVAAAADMGAALTKYAATLGLNLAAYNAMADKDFVHTYLEQAYFGSAADIQAVLDEAVAIQQINLAAAADIGTALADNAALLGLDLTAYSALGDKAPVDAALAAQTFASPADIQAALDIAVAVQQINLAAEADMGAALMSNAGLLGLDLTAYLQLLDTAPVHAALAAQTFASPADIQAALDAAVAAQALIEAGG